MINQFVHLTKDKFALDLFIDDCIDNLNKVEDSVNKVLLFNSQTNIGKNNNFTRVNSWKEIYEYISEYKKVKDL